MMGFKIIVEEKQGAFKNLYLAYVAGRRDEDTGGGLSVDEAVGELVRELLLVHPDGITISEIHNVEEDGPA